MSDDPSQINLSPYHFSRNNPVTLNDPTGLCSRLDCWINKIISFVTNRGDDNEEEVASQAEAINKVHALGVRSNESTETIKDGVSIIPGGGFAMNMAEGDYLGAAVEGGIDVAGGKILDETFGLLKGKVDDLLKGADDVIESMDPGDINFSQRTVSDNVDQYVDDMKGNNWDWNRSGPIRVMKEGGKWVSYDNRRLMAAQTADLPEIPTMVVHASDRMFGSKKTWMQAFVKRYNDKRNIAAGGPVPSGGLKSQPKVIKK